MTDQEKELGIYIAECVNGLADSGDNFKDCLTLAKALIQRYPQILAEKVWEGERLYLSNIFEWANGKSENIEVFIREVVS